jgi:hypothetical protein
VNRLIIQSDHQLEIGKPFAEIVDGWQNNKSSQRHRHLHVKPTSRSVQSANKQLFRLTDLSQDPYAMLVVFRPFRREVKASGRSLHQASPKVCLQLPDDD